MTIKKEESSQYWSKSYVRIRLVEVSLDGHKILAHAFIGTCLNKSHP